MRWRLWWTWVLSQDSMIGKCVSSLTCFLTPLPYWRFALWLEQGEQFLYLPVYRWVLGKKFPTAVGNPYCYTHLKVSKLFKFPYKLLHWFSSLSIHWEENGRLRECELQPVSDSWTQACQLPIPLPPLLPGNGEETGRSLQISGANTRSIACWGNLTKHSSHTALLHHTKLHCAWKLFEDSLYNTVTIFLRLPSWWLLRWTCVSYCPSLVLVSTAQHVSALGLELFSSAWPPFGCRKHSGGRAGHWPIT